MWGHRRHIPWVAQWSVGSAGEHKVGGGVQVRVKVVKVGECEQEGVFLCQSHTHACVCTRVCAHRLVLLRFLAADLGLPLCRSRRNLLDFVSPTT